MAQYVYQRRGGPLVTWAGGVPRQSHAAQARNGLNGFGEAPARGNGMGCGGGGCGCDDCGSAKRFPLSGGYPEYGGRGRLPGAIAVPTIPTPRGTAQRYVSTLGTIPFIPGSPEPLTSDVTDLIDPYQPPAQSSFPWTKVILGGLALAVAAPHLKKLLK